MSNHLLNEIDALLRDVAQSTTRFHFDNLLPLPIHDSEAEHAEFDYMIGAWMTYGTTPGAWSPGHAAECREYFEFPADGYWADHAHDIETDYGIGDLVFGDEQDSYGPIPIGIMVYTCELLVDRPFTPGYGTFIDSSHWMDDPRYEFE